MYVGVIHRISDPEAFQRAEDEAIEAGMPDGVNVPIIAKNEDRTIGVCIWDAPSLEAVQEMVESLVGPYSQNECFSLSVVHGLPAVTA
jgi:hypothetical protein